MEALRLYLKNYRNIDEMTLDFEKNVNIFIGKNGQGKTNILEALYYFACQKSFRGAKNRELIKWDKDFSEATLDFLSRGRDFHAVTRIKKTAGRENFLNGVKKRRAHEMIGVFNAVIFAPEHLGLIKDGPSVRRSVIDFSLSQTDGEYFAALDKYKKVLEQKNSFLRASDGRADRDMLSVWNEQLSVPASVIIGRRGEFIESLSKLSEARQLDISGGAERLTLSYVPSIDVTQPGDIYEALNSKYDAENRAGVSVAGPHRDDMDILINGRAAKTFASQGQQRSAVLSLKLSECDLFYEKQGEYPALLLDDILSELDRVRQSYIVEAIRDRQIFLTCCDEESIEKIKNGRRFYITGGAAADIKEG
ncbi:MAG: DNA replication/repair protein RecF [Clostridia bacterium]|nr:DNA replication/repair protein RecF [Clostridia bacterium]